MLASHTSDDEDMDFPGYVIPQRDQSTTSSGLVTINSDGQVMAMDETDEDDSHDILGAKKNFDRAPMRITTQA